MQIAFPTDENGLTGRLCPTCGEYFKVKFGTGLTGENPCYCPYCRHSGNHQDFMTKEQSAYLKSLVLKEVLGPVLAKFEQSLRELERSTRNGFIQIKVKISGNPIQIKYYRERNLETQMTCDSCGLEFAIYGIFATCPDCGRLNATLVFLKSIEVAKKRLDLIESVEDEALKEGILDDSISGGISAFDAFGKALREHYPRIFPDKPKNLFQNLKVLSEILKDKLGIQVHDLIDQEQAKILIRLFQVRHIYEHNMGVVDEDFVRNVPEALPLKGRKYRLDKCEIMHFLDVLAEFGKKIEQRLQKLNTTNP